MYFRNNPIPYGTDQYVFISTTTTTTDKDTGFREMSGDVYISVIIGFGFSITRI